MTLERWAINYGTVDQMRSTLELTEAELQRAVQILLELPEEVRRTIHTIRSASSKIYGSSILIICDESVEKMLWNVEAEGGLWLGAVGVFSVEGFKHEY